MNFLAVEKENLQVEYIGRGRDDLEAASIRAAMPIAPIPVPISYFEAKVSDSGRDGYMSVGLMTKRCQLDKLVGWGVGSVGYHGDDGNLFVGNGIGKPYGPLYSKGDTVGCGIDWLNDQVFFTKNGAMISAVKSPFSQEEEVYPAVGLRTPRERFLLNFGRKPFKFDILSFIAEKRARLDKTDGAKMVDCNGLAVELIVSHCLHHGHVETMRALIKSFGNGCEIAVGIEQVIEQRTKQLDHMALVKKHQIKADLLEYFPSLTQEDRFMVLLEAIELIENLENLKDKEGIQRFTDFVTANNTHHRDIVEKILALLAYGEKKNARSEGIRKELFKEIESFLNKHAATQDKLCEYLNQLSENMDARIKSIGSPKERRTFTLLNRVDYLDGFFHGNDSLPEADDSR